MSKFDSVTIRAKVDRAAERIGRVWPLYADVGANPLSGFEDRPFRRAVADAEELFGGRGYPSPSQFRRAWEEGRIDPDILSETLEANGIDDPPEALLDRMAERDRRRPTGDHDETLNRLLGKWLAAFLDQGQATWTMPNRDEGFYRSWRTVAPHDDEIPVSSTPVAAYYHERLDDLPETAVEAIYAVLSDHPESEWESILEHQLAALPGWVGLIKQRADDDANPWQDDYPISLVEYVAVRLIVAKHMGLSIEPDEQDADGRADDYALAECWLAAWERSYRRTLLDDVQSGLAADGSGGRASPDAQLVFCIDTSSEIIRRHVERTGSYETHGYAGFFGIPLEYQGYGSTTKTDSCPVMVDPNHHVTERPRSNRGTKAETHDRWNRLTSAGSRLMKSLKNDAAAAFGFVEGAGSLFGAALASRTLAPSAVGSLRDRFGPPRPETFCTPTVADGSEEALSDISTERKVFYAEAAFELMGWDEFAPVVVFTGHRSETVNNPYESSIDCGACSGSPGTPNARTLAAICNEPTVRSRLRDRGFNIPEETVFLAGEHNTTTDEVTLFVDEELDDTQQRIVDDLRDDLGRAQTAAAEERLRTLGVDGATDSVEEAERRTADWAEPRPEIGLSGNAGFVIGPRRLTESVDLGGRSFLHSYDPSADPDGDALENIMSGPLVVCQMINAQYYFSTVDNEVYGSGSKTTHNAVGHVGVVQGNGGDLQMGLPRQSLYSDDGDAYHQPLRLSVVIHAPVMRVTDILERNDRVTELLDNGWLDLAVIDPERDDACFEYQGGLEWEPRRSADEAEPTTPVVG